MTPPTIAPVLVGLLESVEATLAAAGPIDAVDDDDEDEDVDDGIGSWRVGVDVRDAEIEVEVEEEVGVVAAAPGPNNVTVLATTSSCSPRYILNLLRE